MIKSFTIIIFGIIITETYGGYYGYRPHYGKEAPPASFRRAPMYRSALTPRNLDPRHLRRNGFARRADFPFPFLDRLHLAEDYDITDVLWGETITCYEPGATYSVFGLLPFTLPQLAGDTLKVHSCLKVGVDPPRFLPPDTEGLEGYTYACPSKLDLYDSINWQNGAMKEFCKFFFYYDDGTTVLAPEAGIVPDPLIM